MCLQSRLILCQRELFDLDLNMPAKLDLYYEERKASFDLPLIRPPGHWGNDRAGWVMGPEELT